MNDNERNGLQEIIDKAISDIARTEGDSFELDKMNLAEFSRQTFHTHRNANRKLAD